MRNAGPGSKEPIGSETQSRHEVDALGARIEKLTSLLDVAKAMTAQREFDALLRLIVDAATRVAAADRCSLWIVDQDRGQLWTRVAQGLDRGHERIVIPLGTGIAGQVAATGQAINIPNAYSDPRFNRQVDKQTGYRTANILAVPMRHHSDEVTGVLQALNKIGGEAFTAEDEELLVALGANAAAAIENALLYEEIDRLFEGFVRASVTAIESRDPTTYGHSARVARLTLGIAENLVRLSSGPYAELTFSREQMQEMRYAALLHDFGKVGVRENVLTKAKKLDAAELKLIEARFQTLRFQRENAYLRTLLATVRHGGSLPADLDEAVAREHRDLDELMAFIRQCNEPAVLDSGGFERLHDIARMSYADAAGRQSPLLTPVELERLCIVRGSLDPTERLEIESHVTHTFRFLSQIPWTRSLQRVPEIAYAHHEKLDCSGYPRRLDAVQIPVQTRIMTIADIYDALTATDRPYKPAVPHERAVDILRGEAERGQLDTDLLSVFLEAKVHTLVRGR